MCELWRKGRGGVNLLFCPCFLLIITKLIGIQARHVIKVDISRERERAGEGGVLISRHVGCIFLGALESRR